MNRRHVLAASLMFAAVALAACGSKGPLVVPNKNADAKAPAAKKADAKKKAAAQQTPAPPPVQPAPDNGTQP